MQHTMDPSSLVVVFMADGSPRFNTMTANAVRSFLELTPGVMVGLLAPNPETRDYVSHN